MSGVLLHGVRRGHAAACASDGLDRPSAAAFLFPTEPTTGGEMACDVALTLAVYFAMSMSTLREWSEHPPESRLDYYRRHPDRVPGLLVVPAPAEWQAAARWRYRSVLAGNAGTSLPYSRVDMAGPVSAYDVRKGTYIVPSAADIMTAERRTDTRLDKKRGLADKSFYIKIHDSRDSPENLPTEPRWGGCGAVRCLPEGVRHPDLVLSSPFFAAELGQILKDRLPDAILSAAT